jgi:uncharacterized membrane protein
MPTLMHAIHLMAAVLGLGGLGYLLLTLLPSLEVLNPEQRQVLSRAVTERFRWISWSAMVLLAITGIYSVRCYYWEVPWGWAWKLLTIKIVLSFALFIMVLLLTLPVRFLAPLRTRRRQWLLATFLLGIVVVVISAYLRRA